MVLFSFSFAMGKQTTISFKRVTTSDGDYKEDPELGHRLPPRNITGYIDWESRSIILPDEILETVISYELWTDDTCIAHTLDAEEAIAFLSNLNYGYTTIIITTTHYNLIGAYIPQN